VCPFYRAARFGVTIGRCGDRCGSELPGCFAVLRRRQEGELGALATRQFIKVLRLLEHTSVGRGIACDKFVVRSSSGRGICACSGNAQQRPDLQDGRSRLPRQFWITPVVPNVVSIRCGGSICSLVRRYAGLRHIRTQTLRPLNSDAEVSPTSPTIGVLSRFFRGGRSKVFTTFAFNL